MTKNMGGVDRAVRFVLGVAILGVGLSRGAWWGWLGLVPIATAAVSVCPAYLPFGLSTCRKKSPAS
jgi:hypothetical protein